MTQKHKLDEPILDSYTLLPPEIDFVGRKQQDHNRLAQAIFLKYFQEQSRFPEHPSELPPNAIDWVADQLQISSELLTRFDWQGCTAMRSRSQIRAWLGFRSSSLADQDRLRNWLLEDVLPDEFRVSHLAQGAYQRLRDDHIDPPTAGGLKRLVLSASHQHEQGFFRETAERIPEDVKANLHQLVHRKREIALNEAWHEEHDDPLDYPIHELRTDVGEAKVKTMKTVAARLKYLQEIALPEEVFADIPLRFLRQYGKRATLESLSHLQVYHDAQTVTLLAAFCWVRQTQLTDQLLELFILLLNTIRLWAKHRVERELLADFIRVGGKQQLLFRMATAIWVIPDGIIWDVLFPLIGEERLRQLVEEAKQSGNYYQSVQTRISGSYTYHYRQVLPDLLEVLQFRANNDRYKPLIDALSVIIAYLHEPGSHYPADEDIPHEGVIQKQWRSWIYHQDKHGERRVRRVRDELRVLQTLREKLRCKVIWVVAADRFCNPDEDVPADFADKREAYYQALEPPLDADEFMRRLQKETQAALQHFNDTLPDNPDVEILAKDNGWMRLTPLEKQDEPTNLRALKNHIRQRWWMTSLLHILKEVDNRVNFTMAEANGYASFRLFETVCKARLKARGVRRGLTRSTQPETYALLSELTGTGARALAEASIHRLAHAPVMAALQVPRMILSDGKPMRLLEIWRRPVLLRAKSMAQFCPACGNRPTIAYTLRWAMYPLITMKIGTLSPRHCQAFNCPSKHRVTPHQVRLVETCPDCGAWLDIQAVARSRCPACQGDLKTAAALSLRARPFELFMQRTLHSWWGFGPAGVSADWRLPAAPIPVLHRVWIELQEILSRKLHAEHAFGLLDQRPSSRVLQDIVFRALVAWPDSFYAFLRAYLPEKRLEWKHVFWPDASNLDALRLSWEDEDWADDPGYAFVRTAFDTFMASLPTPDR